MLSPRRWVAAAALLFVASQLHAQGITWGPSAGINLASLVGNDVSGEASSRVGFAAGLSFDRPTARKPLFWRSGLHVSMQGSQVDVPSFSSTTTITYINIPFLAGYRLSRSNAAGPYLLGGAQVGVKVSCNVETESGGFSSSDSCSEDAKPIDPAILAGAGMAFAVGLSTVHVAATYAFGLMTIDSGSPADDVRQRVIAITFTYMMPGKRKVN